MGVQVIARRYGKIIGEFETVSELRKFQEESLMNVSNPKELDGADFVWNIHGVKKNMRIELIKGSPIDDLNYLEWVLRQKNVMFPGMRGTYSLKWDNQQRERRELIEKMDKRPIELYIGKDKVELDYLVAYCYEVGNPKDVTVKLGRLSCHIRENGTPEMAILGAVHNIEHKEEVLRNPSNWDEHEIETCYR